MRKISFLALAFSSSSAFAASSYIEGNIQFNSSYLYDSKTTAKMAAGHTFDTDTTIKFKIEDIAIGATPHSDGHHHHHNMYYGHRVRAPLVTLGVEQRFQMSDNFWLGAGYEHLMQVGETMQYRPLFKIGYDFEQGLSLSHRTRIEVYAQHDRWGYKPDTDYRFDNKIAYTFQTHPVKIHYNNVYHAIGAYGPYYPYTDSTMDHEFRLTLTKYAFQPYFEYKSQGDVKVSRYGYGVANSAFLIGGIYNF
ncbi:porin [Vibrio sp. La 4.2.2]|uniref:porin n=1 Tax=Vibrio sp. La 4.2.2 TaxID=2998830 RepID=UPI0022CDEB91|nr:porin [Vibrio sp. La 4.2.2]MDA0109467.1 porin [Vibrio sp. La 4.2.2]